jgi:hypothetical protein
VLSSVCPRTSCPQVVSASYAAAAYLSESGAFSRSNPHGKRILVLANSGVEQVGVATAVQLWRNGACEPYCLCTIPRVVCVVCMLLQELDAAGLAWVGGEAWQPPASLISSGPEAMCDLTLDASIGAVLVGWDPAFSYAKLVCVVSTQSTAVQLARSSVHQSQCLLVYSVRMSG